MIPLFGAGPLDCISVTRCATRMVTPTCAGPRFRPADPSTADSTLTTMGASRKRSLTSCYRVQSSNALRRVKATAPFGRHPKG
jgi:hypothetical protein